VPGRWRRTAYGFRPGSPKHVWRALFSVFLLLGVRRTLLCAPPPNMEERGRARCIAILDMPPFEGGHASHDTLPCPEGCRPLSRDQRSQSSVAQSGPEVPVDLAVLGTRCSPAAVGRVAPLRGARAAVFCLRGRSPRSGSGIPRGKAIARPWFLALPRHSRTLSAPPDPLPAPPPCLPVVTPGSLGIDGVSLKVGWGPSCGSPAHGALAGPGRVLSAPPLGPGSQGRPHRPGSPGWFVPRSAFLPRGGAAGGPELSLFLPKCAPAAPPMGHSRLGFCYPAEGKVPKDALR